MGRKEVGGSAKIGFVPFWSWNLRGLSVAVQVVLIGYIVFYCTDVMGLNAALVATLLMVSKIFDGFTDLIAGYIIDITKTKWGKARPYELSIIGLWLCTWLMFSVPEDLQTVAKCIWVVVAYTCAESIFYTLLSANQTAYTVRAFNNQEVYVKLSSFGGLITIFGVALFNVVTPTLIQNAGVDPHKWSMTVLMLAIPLTIIGLLRFIFVPEKYGVDVTSERISFKDILVLLKSNRYIYIVATITFVSNISGGFGVSVYYYTYIVKNLAVMGVMSLFSVVAMLTMVFYPMILKKITNRQLIQIGCALCVIGGIIGFFAFDNLAMLAIAGILGGIGTLPISMMSGLLLIECADYNEWDRRPRMEGTIGSVNGFAAKIGSAFGTFICGVLLNVSGYDGTLTTQPDTAIFMFRLLNGLIPAGMFLLLTLLLNFYKLDKKIDGMRLENEERRAAALRQKAQG